MEKIKLGKIVNVVGLKGEVKVYNYSDSLDTYERVKAMYFDDELIKIQKVREQKGMVILSLEGIDNRDDAEKMRGKEVYVTEKDLPKLPKGQYYVRDLIGMDVLVSSDETGRFSKGQKLGTVTHVIQNTAQDIFEIDTEFGKVLIPKVPEFVTDISLKKKEIKVKLIEGMLEL